ncbi:MAG: oligosaccharide flippase family protein [Candidatus Paceibacterota bacterium]
MIKKIKGLLLSNTTTRQTVIKNVVWLSFSNFAGRLIRGLFIIFAARLLGAAEYGVFSYALGLAGFFTLFADIGINSILTKEISRDPKRASAYFSTSFWIKIVLLLFTTVLLIFIAPYFSKIESAKTLLYFVALLTIFDNIREFINASFRAKEKMEFEALVNVLMNVAIAVIGAIVLYLSQTAEAITISYVGSAGVGFLVAAFIARDEFKKIISAFDKNLIKPIMSLALPLAAIGLLGVFMLNIDIVMIGWFRSAQEIGYYSAGQKIIQLLYAVPAIIASALFPALSRAAGNKENQKATTIMERGMASIYALAIPVVIGGIILAKPLINFLYGAEYLPGVLTFQILLVTILIIFPQTLLGNMVFAYNKQNKIAIFVALASIGNIIFNYLLIPRFGIAGAALTTVIVQVMYSGLTWNMIKKVNTFKTIANLKKILTASIIMGILVFILNRTGLPVIATVIISAMAYLAALYSLKEPIIHEGIAALKNH